MKRLFVMLLGSFAVLLLVFSPGNSAYAAEISDGDSHCGCEVTYFSGEERNKMVAGLLKTEKFKSEKILLEQNGYIWMGADAVQVIQNHTYSMTLVGVPFVNEAGDFQVLGFWINGGYTFLGISSEL